MRWLGFLFVFLVLEAAGTPLSADPLLECRGGLSLMMEERAGNWANRIEGEPWTRERESRVFEALEKAEFYLLRQLILEARREDWEDWVPILKAIPKEAPIQSRIRKSFLKNLKNSRLEAAEALFAEWKVLGSELEERLASGELDISFKRRIYRRLKFLSRHVLIEKFLVIYTPRFLERLPAGEAREWRLVYSNWLSLRDSFMEENSYLVRSMVGKYYQLYLSRAPDLSIEEFRQEGDLGLLDALYTFDVHLGFKFSGMVRAAVMRRWINTYTGKTARRRNGRSSFTTREKLFIRDFRQSYGRVPLITEILEGLGLSKQSWLRLQEAAYPRRSLDASLGDDGFTRKDLVPGAGPTDPGLELESRHQRQRLARALKLLDADAQEVLALHYGLQSGFKVGLNEIKENSRFKTRQQVQRQIRTALERLRAAMFLEDNFQSLSGLELECLLYAFGLDERTRTSDPARIASLYNESVSFVHRTDKEGVEAALARLAEWMKRDGYAAPELANDSEFSFDRP